VYAVKRVCFAHDVTANPEEMREVREVKALAQLDHPNVVRFNTAWIETPPDGQNDRF
jgi:hypothetical protein